MDLWSLYYWMKKSRLFEEEVARLWQDGLISGEMHLGTGEEAIMAGIVSQLQPDDSIAADHRGTAPFLMRGVNSVSLLKEIVGDEGGLSAGMGGHMHLYSKEDLAASSGIVGSSGPTAVGFALAAQQLRPGSISVALFGEGAMNQGMLMESINLAAHWNLPVLFVCKDDDWAITTTTEHSTPGDLGSRVRGLGARYVQVNGLEVGDVWQATQKLVAWLRSGKGPAFLHAQCVHLEGHFMGLQLLRIIRNPIRELPRVVIPLMRSFFHPGGGSIGERISGMKYVLSTILATLRDPRQKASNDPVTRVRNALTSDPTRLLELDQRIEQEVSNLVSEVVSRKR